MIAIQLTPDSHKCTVPRLRNEKGLWEFCPVAPHPEISHQIIFIIQSNNHLPIFTIPKLLDIQCNYEVPTCIYVCNASLLCSKTLLLNFRTFLGGNSGVFICFFSYKQRN